jgi:hypothetical protein
MMEKVRRHAPVIATLTANGDLELLDGQARVSLGTLPGAPAEGKTANWLVRLKGAGPLEVTVTASAPTAGTASRRVTLK